MALQPKFQDDTKKIHYIWSLSSEGHNISLVGIANVTESSLENLQCNISVRVTVS